MTCIESKRILITKSQKIKIRQYEKDLFISEFMHALQLETMEGITGHCPLKVNILILKKAYYTLILNLGTQSFEGCFKT